MGRRVKELPVPIDAVLQAALFPLLLLANTGCMDLAEREGEDKPTLHKELPQSSRLPADFCSSYSRRGRVKEAWPSFVLSWPVSFYQVSL